MSATIGRVVPQESASEGSDLIAVVEQTERKVAILAPGNMLEVRGFSGSYGQGMRMTLFKDAFEAICAIFTETNARHEHIPFLRLLTGGTRPLHGMPACLPPRLLYPTNLRWQSPIKTSPHTSDIYLSPFLLLLAHFFHLLLRSIRRLLLHLRLSLIPGLLRLAGHLLALLVDARAALGVRVGRGAFDCMGVGGVGGGHGAVLCFGGFVVGAAGNLFFDGVHFCCGVRIGWCEFVGDARYLDSIRSRCI
jgi:hypothetical protein